MHTSNHLQNTHSFNNEPPKIAAAGDCAHEAIFPILRRVIRHPHKAPPKLERRFAATVLWRHTKARPQSRPLILAVRLWHPPTAPCERSGPVPLRLRVPQNLQVALLPAELPQSSTQLA